MNDTQSQAYIERCFAGDELYGDTFDDSEIDTWFKDEATAYSELPNALSQITDEYGESYRQTLLDKIRGKSFDLCVGIGVARGFELEPIAHQVKRFVAIEPSEKYWHDRIGSTPVQYQKPDRRGHIGLPDGSVDLVVAINVLHHIPNVTDVLREIFRVLKPGGILLVREPIVSMGDWRSARAGVTKNERGIPHRWLMRKLRELGAEKIDETYCAFRPIGPVSKIFNIFMPYRYSVIAAVDVLLSRLTSWNVEYHSSRTIKKIAPAQIAIACEKVMA